MVAQADRSGHVSVPGAARPAMWSGSPHDWPEPRDGQDGSAQPSGHTSAASGGAGSPWGMVQPPPRDPLTDPSGGSATETGAPAARGVATWGNAAFTSSGQHRGGVYSPFPLVGHTSDTFHGAPRGHESPFPQAASAPSAHLNSDSQASGGAWSAPAAAAAPAAPAAWQGPSGLGVASPGHGGVSPSGATTERGSEDHGGMPAQPPHGVTHHWEPMPQTHMPRGMAPAGGSFNTPWAASDPYHASRLWYATVRNASLASAGAGHVETSAGAGAGWPAVPPRWLDRPHGVPNSHDSTTFPPAGFHRAPSSYGGATHAPPPPAPMQHQYTSSAPMPPPGALHPGWHGQNLSPSITPTGGAAIAGLASGPGSLGAPGSGPVAAPQLPPQLPLSGVGALPEHEREFRGIQAGGEGAAASRHHGPYYSSVSAAHTAPSPVAPGQAWGMASQPQLSAQGDLGGPTSQQNAGAATGGDSPAPNPQAQRKRGDGKIESAGTNLIVNYLGAMSAGQLRVRAAGLGCANEPPQDFARAHTVREISNSKIDLCAHPVVRGLRCLLACPARCCACVTGVV